MIAAILQLLTLLPQLLRAVRELNGISPEWPKTVEAVTDVVKAVKSANTIEERTAALDRLSSTVHFLLNPGPPGLGDAANTAKSLLDRRD